MRRPLAAQALALWLTLAPTAFAGEPPETLTLPTFGKVALYAPEGSGPDLEIHNAPCRQRRLAFEKETASSDAAAVFRDLLKQVPSSMQERGWPVGLSLGAVTFDSVPRNVDAALREADTLLYEAKRAGKGRLRHQTWPPGS